MIMQVSTSVAYKKKLSQVVKASIMSKVIWQASV